MTDSWISSADDPACAQIAGRLAELERNIERLQEILDSEPDLSPSTRNRLRRQISESQLTASGLRQELTLCRAPLSIVGVEQTQGIQFFAINGQGSGAAPDNSVPLVAQRTTVLRVYINSKTAARPGPQTFPTLISGRVTVDRVLSSGAIRRVRVIQPINGPIAARAAASIDRGDPNHTLNFRVPANDCQGTLRFTVSVYVQGQVIAGGASTLDMVASDRASSDPSSIASDELAVAAFSVAQYARFEPVATFRIHGILVHYVGDGADLPAPSGLDLASTLEYVLRTYPVGRIEFDDCIEIEFDKNLRTPGGGCGPGFEGPGGLMEILRDFDEKSERPAIHVGLLPRQTMTSVGGCGNRNIAAAKVGAGSTLAQEIGHALDRKHAPNAPGFDPDFPHYGAYPWGSIGEYGFDVFTSKVYDPAYSYDFMSYSGNRWVSPYTYMGLRATINERFGLGPDAALDTTLLDVDHDNDQREEMLFLSFRVFRDDTVDVQPSFHLATRQRPPERGTPSEIGVELLDAAGEVLVFQRCRLHGPHNDPHSAYLSFHEAIRWSTDTASIRFLRNGTTIHVHPLEPEAPAVAIAMTTHGTADGQAAARWTCTTDGDPRHLVRYSADGGDTWRVVATPTTQTEYQVQPDKLPGGERCLLQVVSTSGVRTTVTESDPFQVPVTPRHAYIAAADVDYADDGAPHLILRGGAYSPDFGLGQPEDVSWVSDVDGQLGHGFAVVATDLSDGLHTITLRASDGAGGVATASTNVSIQTTK